jgi:hypothetical protein
MLYHINDNQQQKKRQLRATGGDDIPVSGFVQQKLTQKKKVDLFQDCGLVILYMGMFFFLLNVACVASLPRSRSRGNLHSNTHVLYYCWFYSTVVGSVDPADAWTE